MVALEGLLGLACSFSRDFLHNSVENSVRVLSVVVDWCRASKPFRECCGKPQTALHTLKLSKSHFSGTGNVPEISQLSKRNSLRTPGPRGVSPSSPSAARRWTATLRLVQDRDSHSPEFVQKNRAVRKGSRVPPRVRFLRLAGKRPKTATGHVRLVSTRIRPKPNRLCSTTFKSRTEFENTQKVVE